MGDARSVRLSAYAEKLDADAKQRYKDKVILCGGVDPLILTSKEASFDIDLVPKVELSDIKDYLVHTTSFVTHEQLKAKKSLEAHNYLTSGFVKEPLLKSHGDCVVVRAKVNHSQALTTQPLEPWLLIKKDGAVKAAHCTCMAGLGEACSHIGALLFYLEAAANFRDSQACTDKDNAWLPPYLNSVPCLPVSHIDFASVIAKKRRLDEQQAPPPKKKTLDIGKPTQSEWTAFLNSVKEAGAQSAVLAVTKGYNEDFIPVSVKYSNALLGQMARDKPPSWDAVLAECEMFAQAFVVEPKACKEVEAATRCQSSSPTWFAFRAGRVTASTAHASCRTSLNNPSVSLVKKMCYPEESKFFSAATDWGQRKESTARQHYVATTSKKHTHFQCKESGLHISTQEPHLAASPDGLITCACCHDGLLEIKCPYSATCVGDVVRQKNGCLEVNHEGELQIKKGHPYYTQVQVQLFVCQREYCDFLVWTPSDFHVERIHVDTSFCKEVVDKSRIFFKNVLLPELLFKYWTTVSSTNNNVVEESSEDGLPQYCYCGGAESGNMVECSGTNCSGKWFHFKCVNLKRPPKANFWFCKNCRPQMKK
uniref:Inhibitor of growth protein 3 n=1 Tax=Rhipicephalus zambeziensis TaxID=60191 RepID=A0A224Z0X7_9ACAR